MDFSDNIMQLRYSWDTPHGKETWGDISNRVVDNVFKNVMVPKDVKETLKWVINERKFIPGGRFLAQAGREFHQVCNCFCLRAEDSREGWGDLAQKATVMLMSGGGIGVDYSQIRSKGSPLKRSGGTSSGMLPLATTINEVGRGVMAGGNRRSAIWAGLTWDHGDILDFIVAKNWIKAVRDLKDKDFNFPAPLDMTNISVILNRDFFDAYEDETNPKHSLAQEVYWKVIERMCKTGEPGFSVDYVNKNESLRNA